ncbi:hypothetical protein AVEN_91436-1 [Araneus ventricosus]|uniref:Uncharacterized protein n=1 Tax=Araneus ventricosus TaxID=182803 RepID=A0A4Y2QYZ5_ARAVE|nr:hypothetical protein AVEN_91436-1 [Araneus ventricosus]
MLRCCFFERLNLELKTGNKEPSFSRIAESVATKIESVWAKACIVIVNHSRVLQMIQTYHGKYTNFKKSHKRDNTRCADYEDEETDCSSDISEVDLNLDTYKLSTSNRLISLTDPKYKHLTPFLSKSSQIKPGLLSTAVVGNRFGTSERAVAAIASSVLHYVGLITSNHSVLVVDRNKLRREKAKVGRDLKF